MNEWDDVYLQNLFQSSALGGGNYSRVTVETQQLLDVTERKIHVRMG
jgi:hypothetical protein